MHARIFIVVLIVAMTHAVCGDQIQIGIGYGDQVGVSTPDQKNSVIDGRYDFVDTRYGRWCFSLGAGGSYLWTNVGSDNAFLISVFPSVRFSLYDGGSWEGFVFGAAAPSYMSERALGAQRLGGHFTFNDFIGLGVCFGEQKCWSAAWCWRHISNASIFDPNDGIDVPMTFCLLYRF